MFARIHLLRSMGAIVAGAPPPDSDWAVGIFEFSRAGAERDVRRLVLRAAHANPDKGVMYELYQPQLVDVRAEGYLRFRGIEPISLSGTKAAMVQEWLVRFQV